MREAGKNSVVCRNHPAAAKIAEAPVQAPKILMELVASGEVLVKPASHLGGELFEAYRAAAAGAVFRAAERANFAPLSRIAEISRRLVDAGFAVDASDEVRAAAVREGERQVADSVAAAARADQIADRLRQEGLSLMAFQAEGVSWLAPRSGAILADEMGLGKTIQVLAALPAGAGGGAIVVCPKVAKGVWLREAARWRPDLRVSIIRGRGNFRWPESAGEVVVLNYEILPGDDARASLLASCPEGVTLVADEGHALKAGSGKRGSVRGRAFREIADRVRDQGGRAWVVTGSPLLNKPSELWNLLAMCGQQSAVFGSWKRFASLMGGREGQYGMQWTGAVNCERPGDAAPCHLAAREARSSVADAGQGSRHHRCRCRCQVTARAGSTTEGSRGRRDRYGSRRGRRGFALRDSMSTTVARAWRSIRCRPHARHSRGQRSPLRSRWWRSSRRSASRSSCFPRTALLWMPWECARGGRRSRETRARRIGRRSRSVFRLASFAGLQGRSRRWASRSR